MKSTTNMKTTRFVERARESMRAFFAAYRRRAVHGGVLDAVLLITLPIVAVECALLSLINLVFHR